MTATHTRPVRGYGLTIHTDQSGYEVCGFLDGSPVLTPASAERTPNGRRIRFQEGNHVVRQWGDIFCADAETAGLVRQALNEHFDRERANANAFRVISAIVSTRRRLSFLHAGITNLQTGDSETLSFTLEAPDFQAQRDGQAEFVRFIDALGLSEIDDSDQLVGRMGTFEGTGEGRVYGRWPA